MIEWLRYNPKTDQASLMERQGLTKEDVLAQIIGLSRDEIIEKFRLPLDATDEDIITEAINRALTDKNRKKEARALDLPDDTDWTTINNCRFNNQREMK